MSLYDRRYQPASGLELVVSAVCPREEDVCVECVANLHILLGELGIHASCQGASTFVEDKQAAGHPHQWIYTNWRQWSHHAEV